MVMISNQTGFEAGYLVAKYPGYLGHIYSPGGEAGPWPFMPYALDNGAWPAFKNGRPWVEAEWRYLLNWGAMSSYRPLWAIVPDVVGDKDATLANWPKYVDVIRGYGFRPAFAAQDGMTFEDVPDDECMVFIGGSTDWKVAAIKPWCERFPGRVHVGRVNTWGRLLACHQAGAVSVDGTGWFHKKGSQRNDLLRYLKHVSAENGATR